MFVGVGVCGGGELPKLLVCLLCNFCISVTLLSVLKYTVCVIVYCDVVNVQPRFNFSDAIIKSS